MCNKTLCISNTKHCYNQRYMKSPKVNSDVTAFGSVYAGCGKGKNTGWKDGE